MKNLAYPIAKTRWYRKGNCHLGGVKLKGFVSEADKVRLEEIEAHLRSLSGTQARSHLAQLVLRIERLEQRSKPGPKPKESHG